MGRKIFCLAYLPLQTPNREWLNMARSAGVLAKPEDGGAYKAYDITDIYVEF